MPAASVYEPTMSPAGLMPWALVERAMPFGQALQGTSIVEKLKDWPTKLAGSSSPESGQGKLMKLAMVRFVNIGLISLQSNSANLGEKPSLALEILGVASLGTQETRYTDVALRIQAVSSALLVQSVHVP